MKVVLAEKPSVARDLASYLHARSRHDGYFEGSGYQVTWALGHLVGLKEPGDYDPNLKTWSLNTLPFVPESFELKPRGDKRALHQFTVVQRLFRTADEIICATDAGREGELIFRYILALTECANTPALRLWLRSLTPQAIRAAFQSLRPLAEYDNLYAAAKCRSEADWIVGLNATRNYTLRFDAAGILWSVGRVQTPVLAMIVNRDDEIKTFKPQPFWELITDYRGICFRYSGGRFDRQENAQALLRQVDQHLFSIQKVESKPETSHPPQLYDLTELQRDMNRRFGMSAASTLRSAQTLYEQKLITYPRTDSRYLTTDMKKEVPGILRKLQEFKPEEVGKLDLDALSFSGRIVNDSKVTDHHAIIPTGAAAVALSASDQKVYEAVVVRLIAAFYPPCLKAVTTVDGVANQVPFRARGVRVTSPGWTELYPRKPGRQENAEAEQQLPDFSPRESGPHKPSVKQGETAPPKHFTENTLLGAMETAGKLVDELELREALKDKGLGTPATRASVIETLLDRKYVARENKNLMATDSGRYLVAIVRDRNLKSAELTGEWEAKLKRIEAGQLKPEEFMREIVAFTREVVQLSDAAPVDENRLGDCPRCGRPVIRGKRGLGCSAWREGCDFVLWPTYGQRELDDHQLRALLQHRALGVPIENDEGQHVLLTMVDSGALVEVPVPTSNQQTLGKPSVRAAPKRKRTRKSSEAKASSRTSPGKASIAKSSVRIDAEQGSADLGPCPLCGASIVEQKKSYCCSRWQSGCELTIWKRMSGKRISARTAKTLLRHGETSILKGFKSKSGQPFSARLKLQEGKVTFAFDRD